MYDSRSSEKKKRRTMDDIVFAHFDCKRQEKVLVWIKIIIHRFVYNMVVDIVHTYISKPSCPVQLPRAPVGL